MAAWLLSPAGKAICALALVVLIVGAAYLTGKHEGRHEAAIERLQSDIAAEVARKGIDHEVDSLDRYRICLDLGGLRDQCEQLRRLAAATESE